MRSSLVCCWLIHCFALFQQQKLTKLANLFLAHNELDAVPHIPETVRILHLQVSRLNQKKIPELSCELVNEDIHKTGYGKI